MSNKVIILKGDFALSSFRLKKLNEQIKSNANPIIGVTPVYLVYIENEDNIDRLKQLLKAESMTKQVRNNEIFIAPRLGTISPWSSKATDILTNCGFTNVIRIEQSNCVEFESKLVTEKITDSKIYDRMTESLYHEVADLLHLFSEHKPKQDKCLPILDSATALDEIDVTLGLALSESEKHYLVSNYQALGKQPTITELMMFAQANSEHCRHKIFNAEWKIDGVIQEKSLFSMIRNTEAMTDKPAISAYKDNSAVFKGGKSLSWVVASDNKYHQYHDEMDILIKVETHNHPTAISPYPGAATGSGGEIRDEAATGQGSRPKAGLTGYSVSHLKIPGHLQVWEQNTIGKPDRIASSFDIMIQAPLGGAAFNNEFGRPNICGYFRSLEIQTADSTWRGYHKPIMLAGGMGTIKHELAIKNDTKQGDYLIVLGGPAMLIGLGGGAASSMSSGISCEDLDFASVQRGNPEMERRCQEVIDSCWTQTEDSPIRSIHDVGAGGLSNAMPELLDDAGLGGELEIRALQIDTSSMTPMEIWCNESQERYVLSIKPEQIEKFKITCQRERCPYAILGRATKKPHLLVKDSYFQNKPVDIPMNLLFGNTPKTQKNINKQKPKLRPLDTSTIEIDQAVDRLLDFPTVASKKYLITIADRTVSGLVHRDQMVGPWQVPVADCGVSLRDYDSDSGEVMAIGEKAPLALIDGAASARMAVCEALTNIAGNTIGELSNIKLSANWMAASGMGREDEVLFDAVKAIGEELCPELGIGIPVGKDSLSMSSKWENNGSHQVTSPVSLIISAFANIKDVKKSITPYFTNNRVKNLYLIDIAAGKKRLGASSLAQVYNQIGNETPDLNDMDLMKQFWQIIQQSIVQNIICAYHDISDGGIFVTLLEMCMASHIGAEINLDYSQHKTLATLFCEELGAVVAIDYEKHEEFMQLIAAFGLSKHIHKIGESKTTADKNSMQLSFDHHGKCVYKHDILKLQQKWSQTSHWMASLRDNPKSCEQEFAAILEDDKGLSPKIDFDFSEALQAPYINTNRPKVAILREQGVNGQKEMAMAFHKAGFDSYDVHMQDLLNGNIKLNDFQGMAACGGFSYGDVLGAGKGWANSILFHQNIRQQFADYFADNNKFTLGVCNGCQMLSSLKSLIPGTELWPEFLKNTSEQFEARFSSIAIDNSPSIFFAGMQGAHIPVAISHGEGRAVFTSSQQAIIKSNIIAGTYIDNTGKKAQNYPLNPNGSELSTAAITNKNGNVMIMMPHPERVFRAAQMSWSPNSWHDNSPWMRLFYNARSFIK
jgi:phosphoribosylformylglycinamidine synthase